jgi:thymidine kinase
MLLRYIYVLARGNLANYSFRKTDNDKLVMLGETEEYEPLSQSGLLSCHEKKIRKKNGDS